MRKGEIKWYAVHEAGRATVALALHQPVTVVVASDPQLRSAIFFEGETVLRATEAPPYVAVLCGGYAGEVMYYEKQYGHEPDRRFILRALKRCELARKIFFESVWLEEMPWDCEEARATWTAQAQGVQQLLRKNLELFEGVEKHLTKFGFAGRMSLAALRRLEVPTKHARTLDLVEISLKHQEAFVLIRPYHRIRATTDSAFGTLLRFKISGWLGIETFTPFQ